MSTENLPPFPRRHWNPTEAERIEQALLNRLDEAYSDETISPDLAGYFEIRSAEKSGMLPLEIAEIKSRCRGGGAPSGETEPASALAAPIASRGLTLSQPERIMGGYDGGVEIGFDGIWSDETFPSLKAFLRDAKATASRAGLNKDTSTGTVVHLEGRDWVIKPKSSGGGITYSYVLESGGITLLIHGSPGPNIQPVRIRYGAISLIGRDLFHVHAQEVAYLAKIGFIVHKEKLSRVDMQIMLEIPVQELTGRATSRRMTCCARGKEQIFRRRSTGVVNSYTLGADTQICIYDKRLEMEQTMIVKDPIKYQLMVDECLGEDWVLSNTPLTRVEFRLRREALKSFGIDTMSDLLNAESGLVRYLTHKWFRLLDDERKETHTGRQETSRIWKDVHDSFAIWFPGADENRVITTRKRETPTCSPTHLIKQALGCLATAAALVGGVTQTSREFFSYVFRSIDTYADIVYDKACIRSQKISALCGRGVEAVACEMGMVLPSYAEREARLAR